LTTFRTVPKMNGDLLSPAGARYLLHRHFVTTHNWYVRGFDNGGDSWDASSPSTAFSGHGEGQLTGIFESRLASRGVSLRETAMLAATLESLVQEDSAARLDAAYRALGVDHNTPSAKEAEAVIDAYMVMYLQRWDISTVTGDMLLPMLPPTSDWFAYWPATRQ